MAGQGIERREILRMLGIASAVAASPGFVRWSYAFAPAAAQGDTRAEAPDAYTPGFFTAAEYALVGQLAADIIPRDDTPGAEDAGVAEFIDTMAAHDPPLQVRFRGGLAWMEARAQLLHGRPVGELPSSDRVALLEALAYAGKHRPGEEEGRRFFALMREYTVMGYYTSRVGLEALGYPGLRTYSESPACPDPSDTTHQHRRLRVAAEA